LVPAALPASAVVLAVAKVNLPAVALFDFDKAELKAAGLIKLDRLLIDHKGAPLDIVIAVEQTASVRNDANNQALSVARVKTVKAYLVSKGADVKRVRALDTRVRRPTD
jgi:outer membrane protein OmpA-like peptidoglycan-associated protein